MNCGLTDNYYININDMQNNENFKVQSSVLELANVKLHVDDTGGNGQSIVLIHGWPLSGKSWKNQMQVLSTAGYRVIAYDRRGFGESDKPTTGYTYDIFADDLAGIIDTLKLQHTTLVGFSMGGGEVARYISKYGEEKIACVVFAASVTPMMMKTSDNPDGPLEPTKAAKTTADLTADSNAFYDQFTKDFFSANADGNILVTEAERQEALSLCKQADTMAALESVLAFSNTDFRTDLTKVTVPTLIIHGDADGVVPFVGSGERTHALIPHSTLHVVAGGPHGINVSHVEEFNTALLDFLEKN